MRETHIHVRHARALNMKKLLTIPPCHRDDISEPLVRQFMRHSHDHRLLRVCFTRIVGHQQCRLTVGHQAPVLMDAIRAHAYADKM